MGWGCREECGHGPVIEAITVARNCEYQNTCLRIKSTIVTARYVEGWVGWGCREELGLVAITVGRNCEYQIPVLE